MCVCAYRYVNRDSCAHCRAQARQTRGPATASDERVRLRFEQGPLSLRMNGPDNLDGRESGEQGGPALSVLAATVKRRAHGKDAAGPARPGAIFVGTTAGEERNRARSWEAGRATGAVLSLCTPDSRPLKETSEEVRREGVRDPAPKHPGRRGERRGAMHLGRADTPSSLWSAPPVGSWSRNTRARARTGAISMGFTFRDGLEREHSGAGRGPPASLLRRWPRSTPLPDAQGLPGDALASAVGPGCRRPPTWASWLLRHSDKRLLAHFKTSLQLTIHPTDLPRKKKLLTRF